MYVWMVPGSECVPLDSVEHDEAIHDSVLAVIYLVVSDFHVNQAMLRQLFIWWDESIRRLSVCLSVCLSGTIFT